MLPAQPESGDYNPPKVFSVDISKGIRTILKGKTEFNGLALRTIPRQDIDDGNTVRFDVPNDAKVILEIDVYTGQ